MRTESTRRSDLPSRRFGCRISVPIYVNIPMKRRFKAIWRTGGNWRTALRYAGDITASHLPTDGYHQAGFGSRTAAQTTPLMLLTGAVRGKARIWRQRNVYRCRYDEGHRRPANRRFRRMRRKPLSSHLPVNLPDCSRGRTMRNFASMSRRRSTRLRRLFPCGNFAGSSITGWDWKTTPRMMAAKIATNGVASSERSAVFSARHAAVCPSYRHEGCSIWFGEVQVLSVPVHLGLVKLPEEMAPYVARMVSSSARTGQGPPWLTAASSAGTEPCIST